jgi:hypothetical protein
MDSKPHIKTYMAMESQEAFESSSKKKSHTKQNINYNNIEISMNHTF